MAVTDQLNALPAVTLVVLRGSLAVVELGSPSLVGTESQLSPNWLNSAGSYNKDCSRTILAKVRYFYSDIHCRTPVQHLNYTLIE
jgi:hypothetical protein